MADIPEMVIKGPGGSLHLKLVRYQFPSITDHEWDANWLIVSGIVEINGKAWKFEDPCLTNFEAERLAEWLDDVVAGKTTKEIGFVEPNLELNLQSADTIKISFALEAAPPWAEDDDEHGFEVAVSSDLSDAADAIRLQLSQFPIRADRPS